MKEPSYGQPVVKQISQVINFQDDKNPQHSEVLQPPFIMNTANNGNHIANRTMYGGHGFLRRGA